MAIKTQDQWSCGYCDGVATGEPGWWPTIQKTSKYETSVGVCKPCFRLLNDQLKYENKKPSKAKPRATATKKKTTTKKKK
jgi:hypothetical protein